MPSITDILTGTELADFISGYKNNPLWQQSQIQLGNQQYLANQANTAYQNMLANAVPQQQVAAIDPYRMQGLQQQISAAEGPISGMYNQAANTIGGYGQGATTGQNILAGIAGGLGGPSFDQGVAQSYSNFMQPQLMGAQQALQNQANLAWNQGVAGLADGGGFMSSGRNSATAQAMQNIGTQLGINQQQLAYNAAAQAAQAGQQAGMQGAQNRLSAAGTLGQQGLGALGMTGQIAQGQLLPGQIREAAGSTLQQQRQNELNALYQNQLAQYQNPFRALQNYQAGLGVLGSQNYAPNLQVPNNTMALLSLLGVSPSQLVQSGGSTLGNVLGPILSDAAGGMGNVLGNIGSWINQNIFGGFFEDGGYLPQGMVGIAGESGPEMVNGQYLSQPQMVQGPAKIEPLGRSKLAEQAKDWF